MASLRRTFGIAEPVRRGMELKIARAGEWRPQMLGGSAGVSGDVLAGRDLEITWEDVYRGMWFFSVLMVDSGGLAVSEGSNANMNFLNVIQATRRERVSVFMQRWREGLGWIGRLMVKELKEAKRSSDL